MQVRATCNQRVTAPHRDPSCTPDLARRSALRIVNPVASHQALALLVARQSHGCDESALYRYAEAEVAMYRMSELKLVERQHQR